ncbi:MAG: TraM recognition domain-containing protein, partial [bacterium]
FTSNPLIRNIIGQPKSTIDFRKAMDEKKIVIINLSKGRLGEQNANLIGSMLITKIYLAAMSRANVAPGELRNMPYFYCFVDEFQSFVNDSFADILSEARKYKLSLSIAHQYIDQMPENVRSAVFGNVGTTVCFRVGPFDAEIMEKIFFPTFTQEDIVNLAFAQVYLTLMINGVGSPPFSAVTLPPLVTLEDSHAEEAIAYTREHYAKPRTVVEEQIIGWHDDKSGLASKTQDKPKIDNVAPKRSFSDIPKKKDRELVIEEVKAPAPSEYKKDFKTEHRNDLKHLSLKTLKKEASKDTGKHKEELRAILNGLMAKEQVVTKTPEPIVTAEETRPSPVVPPVEKVEPKKLDEARKEGGDNIKKEATKAELAEDALRKLLDV